MDAQKPQSSAIAEAIAAVQDAMAVLTVEGKAMDDSDLRLLIDIKTSCESSAGDCLACLLTRGVVCIRTQQMQLKVQTVGRVKSSIQTHLTYTAAHACEIWGALYLLEGVC